MTPKQTRALQALLRNPTKREAAADAGIDEKTLRRYLSLPEFQQAYDAAFKELVTDAAKQAQQALCPALSALREIVEDSQESASSRISAARSLLEYGIKLHEVSEIVPVLDRLEAQARRHLR